MSKKRWHRSHLDQVDQNSHNGGSPHELLEMTEAVARLLAEPQRFPIIMVYGSSDSYLPVLYRTLPLAAHHAFTLQQQQQSAAASQSDTDAVQQAGGLSVRPAAVRLVTHAAAPLGPMACAERRTYLDVVQQPAPGSPEIGEAKERRTDASEHVVHDESAGRELSPAQLFTERFNDYINSRLPKSTDHHDGATASPADCQDEVDAENTADAAEKTDASTPSPRREVARVQWVVPLWVDPDSRDFSDTVKAWGKVLSGRYVGETVSLVLFVNRDVVEKEWCAAPATLVHKSDGSSDSSGSSGGATAAVFPAVPNGPRSVARWWYVAKKAPLGSALTKALKMIGVSPPPAIAMQPPQPEEVACDGASGVARHAVDGPSGRETAARLPSCLRLPVVVCRRAAERASFFSGRVVGAIKEEATRLQHRVGSTSAAATAGRARQPGKPARLVSAPLYLPPAEWEWVLPQCPPLPPEQTPLPAGTAETAVPPCEQTTSPAFPFVLVANAAEREAELRRAVRRNAVGAATLRAVQRAALATAAIRPGAGAGASAPCQFPTPRYFAPIVADAGSPLTVDGVLSDIFVLEFRRDVAMAVDFKKYADWLHTRRESRRNSITVRCRLRALFRLFTATCDFLSSPLPSRAVTTRLLSAMVAVLSLLGRGRGVMAWPLLHPREGHRHPRVAFIVTHEFFHCPLSAPSRGCDPRSATAGSPAPSADRSEGHSLSRRAFCAPAQGEGDGDSASAARGADAAARQAQRAEDYELSPSLIIMLRRLRQYGWVLVWQEDHRRWPTAVAPPCHGVSDDADDDGTAGGISQFLAPAVAGSEGSKMPSSFLGWSLQRKVSAALEMWRGELRVKHKMWYDRDPTNSLTGDDAESSASPRQPLALRYPPSYTSLDLWQAGLVSEDMGMHLWEGQTVFLDSGQWGTIVDFQPPPRNLFVPWSSHTTAQAQQRWRAQQEHHADFIRYHRWRQQLYGGGTPAHHFAAAFSSLPHHLHTQERDLYPVVRLHGGAAQTEERLVHLLPRRVERLRVRYPRVCVAAAEAQDAVYVAPLPGGAAPAPLHYFSRSRTMTDRRHADHVTLLTLPLSPHRVVTCAAFFIAHVMEAARFPVGPFMLRRCLPVTRGRVFAEATTRITEEWARLHRMTRQSADAHKVRLAAVDGASRRGVALGSVRWRSFLSKAAPPELPPPTL